MEDPFGNYMEVRYESKDFDFQGNVIKCVNPSRIIYTKNNTNAGLLTYQIEFEYENIQAEKIMFSARTGFLNSTNFRKTRNIKVLMAKWALGQRDPVEIYPIRKYGFRYKEGEFGKTLLSGIDVFGYNNKNEEIPFPGNNHDFEYFSLEDVGGPFRNDTTVSTAVRNPIGSSATTPNASFGLFVGLGAGSDVNSKSSTVGGQMSYSRSTTDGKTALVDIDGNGLPDIIHNDRNVLTYYPNISTGSKLQLSKAKTISGISNFSQDESESDSRGWQLNGPGGVPAFFGKDWNDSKNQTRIYLQDVNGDGLLDVVDNGAVLFNLSQKTGENIAFSKTSSNTKNPVWKEKAIDPKFRKSQADIDQEKRINISKSPLIDMVKVWVSPAEGRIEIKAPVRLLPPLFSLNSTVERERYDKNDGVVVSIQKHEIKRGISPEQNRFLQSPLRIPKGDFSEKITNVLTVDVKKGDRILFRVQSGNSEYSNGDFDKVAWSPIITFHTNKNRVIDVFDDNQFVFDSKKDLLIENDTILLPGNGSLSIKGNLLKQQTTDSVKLSIKLITRKKIAKLSDTTIVVKFRENGKDSTRSILIKDRFKYENQTTSLLSEFLDTSAIDKNIERWNIRYDEDSKLFISLEGASNINRKSIDWHPVIIAEHVDSKTNRLQSKKDAIVTTPKFYFKGNLQSAGKVIQLRDSVKVSIKPEIKFKYNSKCEIKMVISSTKGVLQKEILTSESKQDPIVIQRKKGEDFFVSYEMDNLACVEMDSRIGGHLPEFKVSYQAQHSWTSPEKGNYYFSSAEGESFNNIVYRIGTSSQPLPATGLTSGISLGEGDQITLFRTGTNEPVSFNAHNRLGQEAVVWTNHNDIHLGPLYRGWGQFSVNRMRNLHAVLDSASMRPSQEEPTDVTKVPFFSLAANTDTRRWMGPSSQHYISGDTISVSRLATADVEPHDVFNVNTQIEDQGAIGIIKEGKGTSISNAGGVGFVLTKSNGSSNQTSDFLDLNGDRFPDLVTKKGVQFTNYTGGLSHSLEFEVGSNISQTNQSSNGENLGGFFLHTIPTLTSNRTENSNKVSDAGAKTAMTLIGLFPLMGAQNYSSSDAMQAGFFDANGDGLPDKIKDGAVYLNLGYRFSTVPIRGAFPIARTNSSKTKTFGGGINLANNSVSAGYNLSGTESWSDRTFADLNGDGISDEVVKTQDGLQVRFGLGSGISSKTLQSGRISDFSYSLSDSKGVGGSFTAGVSFWVLKVVFTPSSNLGIGSSSTRKQFLDFNGDGYVDYLENDGESNNLIVRLSNLGRVNRIKNVNRPLNGSFTLDYKQSEATFDHPGGKWVLSSVVRSDGVNDDGLNPKSNYEYKEGKYDRYERQFLGFGQITETQFNENKVYRKLVKEFNNNNIYESGNLIKEYVENHKGERYTETAYTYLLYTRKSTKNYKDRVRTNAVSSFYNGIIQTPVYTQTNIRYEGKNSSPLILNETQFEDNEFGDVSLFKYSDKGELKSKGIFDYKVSIQYFNYDTAKNYMAGLPKVYEIRDFKGNVLRKQEAEYYGWTEKSPENRDIKMGRRIKSRKIMLDGSSAAQTKFNYDFTNGNLTKVELPNGVFYEYKYEDYTQTHVSKIIDAFSLTNEFKYEEREALKFGRYERRIFTNKRTLRYKFDDFGRVNTIIGTNEADEETSTKDYTLSFEYRPEGNRKRMPYAITRHYDQLHAGDGIFTINYIDGDGKSLQIKKTGSVDGIIKWIVSGRKYFDQLGREVKSHYPMAQKYSELKGNVDELSREFSGTFDSEANPTRVSFDILDRQLELYLPDGKLFSSSSYDIAVDGFGKRSLRTSTSYTDTRDVNRKDILANGSGQLSTEILFKKRERLQEQKEERLQIVKTMFHYDPLHQLDTVYNNRGIPAIASKYDIGGRRIVSFNNSGGTVQFKYDEAGNLIKRTNGRGQSVSYNYDRNRIRSIVYSDHPSDSVSYFYGRLESKAEDLGRVIYMEDGTGAQAFEYDNMGNVKKNTRTIIVPFDTTYTYSTGYEYDSWGKLLKMVYPDGQVVDYKYNEAGQLTNVSGTRKDATDPAFSYIKGIEYDKFGQRRSVTWGNGIKTNYSYELDKRRRLEEIKSLAKDGSELFTSRYHYDDLDNVKLVSNSFKKNNGIGGVSMTHVYDYNNLNQLINGKGNWDQGGNNNAAFELKLDYDDLYNIKERSLKLSSRKVTRETQAAFLYSDEHPMQLASLKERINRNGRKEYQEVNDDSYYYDKNGNNVLKSVADSFQLNVNRRKIYWDEENRIRTVSINGYVSSYTYDANGERTIKLSTQGTGSYVDGKLTSSKISGSSISMYVNPYYSVRNGGTVGTKHIYIGDERIVSQLSDQKNWADTQKPNILLELIDYPKKGNKHKTLYNTKKHSSENAINAFYDSLAIPHARISKKAFANRIVPALPIPANPIDTEANIGKPDKSDIPGNEPFRYFYHRNHLGSTSFITDNDAKVVQYVEYLPYGETFMEQRQDYSSQFLFNGKEQDQETGLYYYGARYYDPHTYQWLGVDPMAEKYPGLSPYNFSLNSPLRYLDQYGTDVSDEASCKFTTDPNEIKNELVRENIERQRQHIERIVSEDRGLETPLFDPLDILPVGLAAKAVVKGSKNLLSIGAKMASEGTAEIITKGGGNAFRYMTEAELKAIQNTGLLRGGRAGETFFTKDLYKSAASAQNRLALPSAPTLRVEFQILNNPTLLRSGTKVLPANGMMGRGAEFMTLDPVKVNLINWQPLR